jgi:hypothetical protein
MAALSDLLVHPLTGLVGPLYSSLSDSVAEWSGVYAANRLSRDTRYFVNVSSCAGVPCGDFLLRDDSSTSTSTSTTTTTTTSLANGLVVPLALALAVGLGVGLGVGAGVFESGQSDSNQRLNANQISAVVAASIASASGIPANVMPFPNVGSSFDDTGGCGDNGVRTRDGLCHPVLTRGPCSALHWITVRPSDLTVIT